MKPRLPRAGGLRPALEGLLLIAGLLLWWYSRSWEHVLSNVTDVSFAEHRFLVGGEYILSILSEGAQNQESGSVTTPAEIEISVDGQTFHADSLLSAEGMPRYHSRRWQWIGGEVKVSPYGIHEIKGTAKALAATPLAGRKVTLRMKRMNFDSVEDSFVWLFAMLIGVLLMLFGCARLLTSAFAKRKKGPGLAAL
jgi:hypothetical protein